MEYVENSPLNFRITLLTEDKFIDVGTRDETKSMATEIQYIFNHVFAFCDFTFEWQGRKCQGHYTLIIVTPCTSQIAI